jgi:hypothetical protein
MVPPKRFTWAFSRDGPAKPLRGLDVAISWRYAQKKRKKNEKSFLSFFFLFLLLSCFVIRNPARRLLKANGGTTTPSRRASVEALGGWIWAGG